MSHSELRFLAGEMSVAEGEKAPMLIGYAAVFNSLSEELRMNQDRRFREVVRPGAFSASLASGRDVIARFNHSGIIGRRSNGTLRLMEDARGLRYEIDPPDTQEARDLITLVRRGDIRASSFEFKTPPKGDSWRREGETLIRELHTVTLIEVSPVANPAYPATDVALRSLDAWISEEPSIVSYSVRNALRLSLAERN